MSWQTWGFLFLCIGVLAAGIQSVRQQSRARDDDQHEHVWGNHK